MASLACSRLSARILIRGFCHLAIGQETVSVSLEHGITKDDRVIAYRHSFAVTRGDSIKGVISELLGRQIRMSHGKGSSIHFFTPSFSSGNSVVGAQVSIGAGVGIARKYMDEETCTFALHDDGASNQGQAFEAFNMNLPAIFICENYKYGMRTSSARSSSNAEYFTHGDKIPGLQGHLTHPMRLQPMLSLDMVNGVDVIATKRVVEYAGKWAVEDEKGALLLAFVTYRFGGHSMSDPGTPYRTRKEVQCVRSTQDTIRGLQKYIEEWGLALEQELKALDKESKGTADAAVEEAKASPEPESKDLWTDIYFEGMALPVMRGREMEEVRGY